MFSNSVLNTYSPDYRSNKYEQSFYSNNNQENAKLQNVTAKEEDKRKKGGRERNSEVGLCRRQIDQMLYTEKFALSTLQI